MATAAARFQTADWRDELSWRADLPGPPTMEITSLECDVLGATLDVTPEEYYADWLSQPADVYDPAGPDVGGQDVTGDAHDPMELEQVFVRVRTDDGEEGFAGPLYGGRPLVPLVGQLGEALIGRDPLATETLWDLLYRTEVHGRKGKTMQAISVVDCALWDLKGSHYDEPVHRLLGGPTRDAIPAYASMLGHSVDPAAVEETAADFQERGYDAQKWFFRHGIADGRDGQRENVALVGAARRAVGEEYDLMFDAWMSWDLTYAREMIDRIEAFDPRWLEEPVQPDKIDQYATLRADAPFAIAGGEHEYTRWGAHELLARDAVDVLQIDPMWGGGLTEMEKICALASVRDVPVVPHGWSLPACCHLVAAKPVGVCPLVEHLVSTPSSYFLTDDIAIRDGGFEVPDGTGLGIHVDESAVDSREVVTVAGRGADDHGTA